MFYCSLCGHQLNWHSDFDFEDYGYSGEGVVGVYTCSNSKCSFDYKVLTPSDDSDDNVKIYISEPDTSDTE